jgi:hypothetical protein
LQPDKKYAINKVQPFTIQGVTMHTLAAYLIIIWAAIITQEAPGPFFGYDTWEDTSVSIARVVVVDQQGQETVLTPEYYFDTKGGYVYCNWQSASRVECLDTSDGGPVRVEYYLKPTEYRQFVPVVARPAASTESEAPHTSRRWK